MRLSKFIPFVAIFCVSVWAEPYLSPTDPFIRHEIRFLGDEGGLNGLQNTWPLDLGGLSSMRNDAGTKLPHSLLDDKISAESRSGLSPIFTTIGLADDRVTARGFGPEPRSSFATNASVSWLNDRFAAKLSLNAFYGMEKDWKGREDEGIALDGSYLAARLGNWSASFGQVERWWGPGWDGNLILSTNARPIPAISLDRRVPEPFETKWLSWIGPWSFHSFIGRLEKERTIPNPYLWGMRGEFRPTLVDGLEIGFFRMMQLGGMGRPEGFSTWVDSFLGQDNYGGQSKHQDKSKEPGNQLAGIDVRWKALDLPIAFYGQVVGEDEDNFLPNALMFQYGVEAWKRLSQSTIRVFAEYVDLTTIWWSDPDYSHNSAYNVSYGHTIYQDGYRFKGRPIGHWSDQDSRIITAGCILQRVDGVGWGTTLKIGELNSDASGGNSISNKVSSDYFSMGVFNSRYYSSYDLAVYSSIGWESIAQQSSTKNRSVTGSLMLTKKF